MPVLKTLIRIHKEKHQYIDAITEVNIQQAFGKNQEADLSYPIRHI